MNAQCATEPQKSFLRKSVKDIIQLTQELQQSGNDSPHQSSPGGNDTNLFRMEGEGGLTSESGTPAGPQGSLKGVTPESPSGASSGPIYTLIPPQMAQRAAEIGARLDSGALNKMEASRLIGECRKAKELASQKLDTIHAT